MFKRLAVPLVVALAAAVPAAGNASTVTLAGVTGPGFTITLKKAGIPVQTLKAGTYKIVVTDNSSIHNFHLVGPGVNKLTAVSFVGKQVWTVTLKAGSYTFQCDVHATLGMKGTFRVR